MNCRFNVWFLLVAIACVAGCSRSGDPSRKIVIPVKGIIIVDGQTPSSPVSIVCEPVGGVDVENPTVSQCVTNTDGSFALSTYESGDGVPPGEYVLLITWGKMNVISMSYGGDEFKGKYNTVPKSPKRFTVEDGDAVDLGVINLTTK